MSIEALLMLLEKQNDMAMAQTFCSLGIYIQLFAKNLPQLPNPQREQHSIARVIKHRLYDIAPRFTVNLKFEGKTKKHTKPLNLVSPVRTRTPTIYLDFKLDPGAIMTQPIEEGWTAFIYTISGMGSFGGGNWTDSEAHYTLLLGSGDHVQAKNVGKEVLHFVLIAGEPLNEPIVQHGPFVMNSHDEIKQAFSDYSLGVNGFERAPGWRSEIGKAI